MSRTDPSPEKDTSSLVQGDPETYSSTTSIQEPLIYLDEDTLKLNEHIEERIGTLQKTMLGLHNEILAEKEAWKKDSCLQPTVSDSVFNYEERLSEYQRTLLASNNRNLIRRQLAVDAYKQRLLEVESMCNLELLRVKQSVQFLAPLQQLAAEWDLRYDSGDAKYSTTFDEQKSHAPTLDSDMKSQSSGNLSNSDSLFSSSNEILKHE